MATETLVSNQIEEGKKLLELLDRKGLRVRMALWLNTPENDDWRLLFALPHINQEGSRKTFEIIQQLIVANNVNLSLGVISLIDDSNDLYKLLRNTIVTGPTITTIHFLGNFINGQRFPDSIIYRVD